MRLSTFVKRALVGAVAIATMFSGAPANAATASACDTTGYTYSGAYVMQLVCNGDDPNLNGVWNLVAQDGIVSGTDGNGNEVTGTYTPPICISVTVVGQICFTMTLTVCVNGNCVTLYVDVCIWIYFYAEVCIWVDASSFNGVALMRPADQLGKVRAPQVA